MLGIYSDSGSEFINQTLYSFCKKHGLKFTHFSPYQKNDNCFVEQKNYAVVKVADNKRVGSRVSKRYDIAKTPYRRLLAWSELKSQVKQRLEGEYQRLNPVELMRQREQFQGLLLKEAPRVPEIFGGSKIDKANISSTNMF